MVRQRKNSGQILVISSLVVVLLLLSTVVYVSETQKNAPVYRSTVEANYWTLQQSVLHTVASALVNVSNGGDVSVLGDDLDRLASVLHANLYNSVGTLQYVVVDSTPYQNGVWLYTGEDGLGVSSVAVEVQFNATGVSGGYAFECLANLTSQVNLTGSYIALNETCRQVNITCTVAADDCPAKAQTLDVFYQQDDQLWISASHSLVDYGNGTYGASFLAPNCTLAGLPVSVHCADFRGVSVWANVTCLSP